MNVDIPENKPQNSRTNQAEQERIREFCYELALALRRITGKVLENDLDFLEKEECPLPGAQTETTSDNKSNL